MLYQHDLFMISTFLYVLTTIHLQNKGQVLESTGLYFEAALKFLHVASLLETPSLDSSRQADAAQSMKMYSETAKLCE